MWGGYEGGGEKEKEGVGKGGGDAVWDGDQSDQSRKQNKVKQDKGEGREVIRWGEDEKYDWKGAI